MNQNPYYEKNVLYITSYNNYSLEKTFTILEPELIEIFNNKNFKKIKEIINDHINKLDKISEEIAEIEETKDTIPLIKLENAYYIKLKLIIELKKYQNVKQLMDEKYYQRF
ncbi:MAG: hypothetical protein PVH88_09050 [Ignavibacteria bacterium]